MSNPMFHPWPGHPCAGHSCDGCALCQAGGCCGSHAVAAAQQTDNLDTLRQALSHLTAHGGGIPTLRSLAVNQGAGGGAVRQVVASVPGRRQLASAPVAESAETAKFGNPDQRITVQRGAAA